jgi:hypothetical protein
MRAGRDRVRDTALSSRERSESASVATPVARESNVVAPGAPSLEQQAAFFHTFGALKVPGLFAPEIDMLSSGFDEVFRDHPSQAVDPQVSLHRVMDPERGASRVTISGFIDRNPKLAWLRDDPRVTDLAHALVGDGYTYQSSVGNLFNSYIYWHSDYFRSAMPPETRLKIAFYLDALDGRSGALRVIPGTNHLGPYRSWLYDEATSCNGDLRARFGLSEDQLPCWTLAVQPGDVVVWNNTTLHANFNGGSHRRMFSLHFAERAPSD